MIDQKAGMEYKRSCEQWGSFFSILNPNFRRPLIVSNNMYGLKKDLTPTNFWEMTNGLPEGMDTDPHNNPAHKRVNDGHYWVQLVPHVASMKAHY